MECSERFRLEGGRARAAVVSVGLALLACSSSPQEAKESIATTRATIVNVDGTTTVEAGAPLTRNATCPDHKLPDVCGSWAGVELSVARGRCDHHQRSEPSDSHCLCEPINFKIPAQIPVAEGHSGWSWDKPELAFRNAAGKTVTCRYRGNGTPFHGGDAYTLDKCSDGSRAGQDARGDFFTFTLDDSHPGGDAVAVVVRLGEPDVVDGVVQEQIFYASDSRIAGAALHVPRGSAPPGESFSLTPLRQVPPRTVIANAGDGATTLGYAVDVHASSTDNFVFTPVPGASCPRIDLPYDQAAVSALLGPGRESDIDAQQLLTLTGIAAGARVLGPAGDAKVNRAAHTISFCVEHLSYWLPALAGFNATLVAASIRSVAGSAPGSTPLGLTDLFSSLPGLYAGETYELSLTFRNHGSTAWTPSNVRLVPVDSFNGATANVLTTLSPWGFEVPTPWTAIPHGNTAFTPASVPGPVSVVPGDPFTYSDATFVFKIKPPSAAAALNFCLKNTTNPAFGECFTWDLPGAANPGKTKTSAATSRACYTGSPGTAGVGTCHAGTQTYNGTTWSACAGEVTNKPAETTCDGQDEDCDGNVDDDGVKNACGGCAALAKVPNVDKCDNGRSGICLREATYHCSGKDAVSCEPQTDNVENACGGCANELSPARGTACNNGREGVCYRDGTYDCNGTDATACNAQRDGVENACGGCGALNIAPGTGCNNGRPGSCFRTGTYQCSGADSVTCDAPASGVENACGTCDDHCIIFRMEEVDDDAYLWDGIPLDVRDAICVTHIFQGQRGSIDCDLSAYMNFRYGGVRNVSYVDGDGVEHIGWRDFTVMLGNGGGFQTYGIFSLIIDGNQIELSREWHDDWVHTGWVHGHRFMIDFVNGTVDGLYRGSGCGDANPKACCLPTDCTLPFLN